MFGKEGGKLKLNLNNLEAILNICEEKTSYDVQSLKEQSIKDPKWIHFGAGNIFRGYVARLNQDLINNNHYDRGISVVEGFDEEIIEKIYNTYDNLTLSVTLNKEGNFSTNLISNLVEGLTFSKNNDRIIEIMTNPNLQVASFTITEKGYSILTPIGDILDIVKSDISSEPKDSKHLMSRIAYLLYQRYKSGANPVAMVSMDNCSKNGDKLKDAIIYIVNEWIKNGKLEKEFLTYLNEKVSFPWSMIDKITPRPSEEVEKYLNKKGIEEISPIITKKHTYISAFVNSEEAEYLVIEDNFPNKRPALEKVGVYLTEKDTVNKMETMKVTTCLNPLHTALAVYGCLLGYTKISDEMKDKELVNLVKKIGYDEALPVVIDPKILNPKDFIDEVINVRLPNPYIPDMPQRIATDTSQKVGIRFGETIKSYIKSDDKNVSDLKYIPLVLAGWLRYLLAIDDKGNKFDLSPDPLLSELSEYMQDIKIGQENDYNKIRKLLENERIFGVNLVKNGLDDLIIKYLDELTRKVGSVRITLEKYLGDQ